MLDQNTDRMWYVIGAVIIGAAIIFILNGTMPELFASVGETFEDKTDDVKKVVDELTIVDGIGPSSPADQMGFEMRDATPWMNHAAFEWLSDTSVKFSPNENFLGGIILPDNYFEMGESYTVEFDIQKLSGDIQGLGGHIHFSDQTIIEIDGRSPKVWTKGSTAAADINTWSKGVEYPNDTLKHHVSVTFTKNRNVTNENNKFYIQINRAGDATYYEKNALDYTVLIENIELFHHI